MRTSGIVHLLTFPRSSHLSAAVGLLYNLPGHPEGATTMINNNEEKSTFEFSLLGTEQAAAESRITEGTEALQNIRTGRF